MSKHLINISRVKDSCGLKIPTMISELSKTNKKKVVRLYKYTPLNFFDEVILVKWNVSKKKK